MAEAISYVARSNWPIRSLSPLYPERTTYYCPKYICTDRMEDDRIRGVRLCSQHPWTTVSTCTRYALSPHFAYLNLVHDDFL